MSIWRIAVAFRFSASVSVTVSVIGRVLVIELLGMFEVVVLVACVSDSLNLDDNSIVTAKTWRLSDLVENAAIRRKGMTPVNSLEKVL